MVQDWGIGSTELNRFFFVITMKYSIAEDERETVRAHVRNLLQEIGIKAPTLYFVDVVHYPDDDEFGALKADVETFIIESKSELFGSWLAQARTVVNEARTRCAAQLEDAAGSELQRSRRIKKLDSQLTKLNALIKDYNNSARWGAPWARNRVEQNIKEKADGVAQIVKALQSRNAFDGVRSRLSDAIVELNRSAKATIATTHAGLLGKLQSSVAGIRPNTSIQVSKVTIDSDLFPGTDILEATGSLYWRNIVKRLWQRAKGGTDVHADVAENRGRIVEPWRKSRDRGTAKAKSLIAASIEDMNAELQRISASIKAELNMASQPASSPKDLQMLKEACALASEWLSRLDALGRQAKQAGR